jgi:hypothetical protein
MGVIATHTAGCLAGADRTPSRRAIQQRRWGLWAIIIGQCFRDGRQHARFGRPSSPTFWWRADPEGCAECAISPLKPLWHTSAVGRSGPIGHSPRSSKSYSYLHSAPRLCSPLGLSSATRLPLKKQNPAAPAGRSVPGPPRGSSVEGYGGGERLSGHHEQPVVLPQVMHFRQVPLRTRVKLPQSSQESPS